MFSHSYQRLRDTLSGSETTYEHFPRSSGGPRLSRSVLHQSRPSAKKYTIQQVGCANWGSFWLNEGFTTYLERLILRELHGDAERSFSYIIGKKALDDALREFKVGLAFDLTCLTPYSLERLAERYPRLNLGSTQISKAGNQIRIWRRSRSSI